MIGVLREAQLFWGTELYPARPTQPLWGSRREITWGGQILDSVSCFRPPPHSRVLPHCGINSSDLTYFVGDTYDVAAGAFLKELPGQTEVLSAAVSGLLLSSLLSLGKNWKYNCMAGVRPLSAEVEKLQQGNELFLPCLLRCYFSPRGLGKFQDKPPNPCHLHQRKPVGWKQSMGNPSLGCTEGQFVT